KCLPGPFTEGGFMIKITLTNERQDLEILHETGPIEFGRGGQRDVRRVMIEDGMVSRDQLRVEELPEGRVRVENLSLKVMVALEDGSAVPLGSSRELVLPVQLVVGSTRLTIELELAAPSSDEGSSLMTISQPIRRDRSQRMRTLNDLGDSPAPEKLAQ